MNFELDGTAVMYGIVGVVLIAVLLQYQPKFGGWLLLLIVLGLLLSPKARAIIATPS